MPSRSQAQTVTDRHVRSLCFSVKMEAKRYGVNVLGSEIIGAVPMEALSDSIEYYLGLDGFKIDKIIENELLK